MVLKLLKTSVNKETILKAGRERYLTYRGKTMRMTINFSSETRETKQEKSQNIFQLPKEKDSHQNSLSRENILHEWGENQDSQMKKN